MPLPTSTVLGWLRQVIHHLRLHDLTRILQIEHGHSMKMNGIIVDQAKESFGATRCGAYGGYFITVDSKTPIDLDRMTGAFEETVNRHGSFRTTFHWEEEEGKLMQIIYPSVEVHSISIVDLSDEPNPHKTAYDMSVANNVEPRFSFNEFPPIFLAIFALGGGTYAFNITVRHNVTDETSLGVFLRDLLQVYTHGPDSLPPVQLH